MTTFTILTTSPNAPMAEIHDRMPVIIAPDSYSEWLDLAVTDVSRLQALAVPYCHAILDSN
jgi:putative SOS response-associated peptidase YedK